MPSLTLAFSNLFTSKFYSVPSKILLIVFSNIIIIYPKKIINLLKNLFISESFENKLFGTLQLHIIYCMYEAYVFYQEYLFFYYMRAYGMFSKIKKTPMYSGTYTQWKVL